MFENKKLIDGFWYVRMTDVEKLNVMEEIREKIIAKNLNPKSTREEIQKLQQAYDTFNEQNLFGN